MHSISPIHILCHCHFADAAIVGQLKLVKLLVERGADPNFKNRKGKTPCDVASAAVYNFLTTTRGKLNAIRIDLSIHSIYLPFEMDGIPCKNPSKTFQFGNFVNS